MDKIAYYVEEIEKAASIDAARKKQYWQILKKMYGSGEEAIKAIKRRNDPYVYHGTSNKAVKSILNKGINRAENAQYGSGSYMGPYESAKSSAVQKTHNYNRERYINTAAEPQIRLKTPREMTGKEKYPNTNTISEDTNIPTKGRKKEPFERRNSGTNPAFNGIIFENGIPSNIIKQTDFPKKYKYLTKEKDRKFLEKLLKE